MKQLAKNLQGVPHLNGWGKLHAVFCLIWGIVPLLLLALFANRSFIFGVIAGCIYIFVYNWNLKKIDSHTHATVNLSSIIDKPVVKDKVRRFSSKPKR